MLRESTRSTILYILCVVLHAAPPVNRWLIGMHEPPPVDDLFRVFHEKCHFQNESVRLHDPLGCASLQRRSEIYMSIHSHELF